METKETILEKFEKSTEQENDVKQEQVEQVSQDVEEHAPEIVVHETSAESSYEEAEDKEPVEVKEEEETAEQVEEPKEEEVEEIKEEEPAESQEPKEEVEKSTKDSKEDDEDEEEDSKDSEKDKDDEEDDDKDKDDKSKKSESDMFEAIKSIIDSSMGQINERIAKLEDTVTKGLVTETVESEPVEQEVEPKVEAETIKEEEPVEEVTEAEPEAVIEAEEVEEPKEEEEPAEVEEEEEVTSKSVKVATQNRENDDEQAIKSVIQDDEDAVGYASKDASRIQETLEEETTEEETAKSFDGVAQTTEVKENPQEFMTENRQAFLDELSKAYKSSGFSNGYREDLRRAFLDINNGSQNKEQFELVKSFLNK